MVVEYTITYRENGVTITQKIDMDPGAGEPPAREVAVGPPAVQHSEPPSEVSTGHASASTGQPVTKNKVLGPSFGQKPTLSAAAVHTGPGGSGPNETPGSGNKDGGDEGGSGPGEPPGSGNRGGDGPMGRCPVVILGAVVIGGDCRPAPGNLRPNAVK